MRNKYRWSFTIISAIVSFVINFAEKLLFNSVDNVSIFSHLSSRLLLHWKYLEPAVCATDIVHEKSWHKK